MASDADSFSWGLYKTNQKVLLPFASSPDYISSLNDVIAKFGIDAVIPGSEPEVFKLAHHRNEINAPVIMNDPELMPLMQDKYRATEKIMELGLPVIPTVPLEDYKQLLEKFDFPFIIKPTKGTGGSRGLKLATKEQDILDAIEELPENSGVCIQPYIGDGESEYTVGVLSDKDANVIDSIVMKRKLIGLSLLDSKKVGDKQFTISTGYSQGFFIEEKTISDFCEKLAYQLKSRGPLNIQLRVHKGEIYIFEIHPRFSGTSTMRADVGFNEADVLLRNVLFGEAFSRLNYKNNVAVIRAFEHAIVPIDEML
ncbi:MAG: ATP-grasp domain-containing protein [Flavobacteriales bacterium]